MAKAGLAEIVSDYEIYDLKQFNPQEVIDARIKFDQMVQLKVLTGSFDDSVWNGSNTISTTNIRFDIDEDLYNLHGKNLLHVPYQTAVLMAKSYILSCINEFILFNLSERAIGIKKLLEGYGQIIKILREVEYYTIPSFLDYVGLSPKEIAAVDCTIDFFSNWTKNQRKLAPIINYLAFQDAIERFYSNVGLSDEEFIKWFPCYFWTEVSFRIPLRPTEIILTPIDCLKEENGKIFLRLRRTQLKKRRRITHTVSGDYRIYEYEIPDNQIYRNIKKYLELTKEKEREFLILGKIKNYTNPALLNQTINDFQKQYIVGNPYYSFSMYASGIEEWSPLRCGDSRPLAMSNLYFQDAGADICRQLAGHETVDVSYHYYSNIGNTINASSVIRIQKKASEIKNKSSSLPTAQISSLNCLSEKRAINQADISDCEGHYYSCWGCKYYSPTQKDIDAHYAESKKDLDELSVRMIDCLNKVINAKEPDENLDKLLPIAQTASARYSDSCDIKNEGLLKEWLEKQNLRMQT